MQLSKLSRGGKSVINLLMQNSIFASKNTIPPYIQKLRILNPLTDLSIFDMILIEKKERLIRTPLRTLISLKGK